MTPQERAALVDQLRHRPINKISVQILKATYEIEDLAQQVATLRTALEPFAKAAAGYESFDGQHDALDSDEVAQLGSFIRFTAGDFRRARAALAQTEPKVTT